MWISPCSCCGSARLRAPPKMYLPWFKRRFGIGGRTVTCPRKHRGTWHSGDPSSIGLNERSSRKRSPRIGFQRYRFSRGNTCTTSERRLTACIVRSDGRITLPTGTRLLKNGLLMSIPIPNHPAETQTHSEPRHWPLVRSAAAVILTSSPRLAPSSAAEQEAIHTGSQPGAHG